MWTSSDGGWLWWWALEGGFRGKCLLSELLGKNDKELVRGGKRGAVAPRAITPGLCKAHGLESAWQDMKSSMSEAEAGDERCSAEMNRDSSSPLEADEVIMRQVGHWLLL